MKDGFININKAADMTSHDVVNIIRKILQTKKIGHGGTLDPFATGVLPVAVGRATKFIEYLSGFDKSYRAQILFGTATDTGDITGNVINSSEFTMPSLDDINSALTSLTGVISQTPPKFSAIKINGKKAYELARKNIDFAIPERTVTIYKMSIVEITENTLTIDVDCSKGTYIRSLAVDIGSRLNIPATLKTLQRTRVGSFSIYDSLSVEELKNVGESAMVDVEKCLLHLPKLELPEQRLKAFCSGLTTNLHTDLNADSIYRIYINDSFVGTGKVVEGEIKADKLFYINN